MTAALGDEQTCAEVLPVVQAKTVELMDRARRSRLNRFISGDRSSCPGQGSSRSPSEPVLPPDRRASCR